VRVVSRRNRAASANFSGALLAPYSRSHSVQWRRFNSAATIRCALASMLKGRDFPGLILFIGAATHLIKE
jgi:hypothetical protein